MIDIIFWFSPIDLLFPLPLFGIGHEVDAWQIKELPEIVTIILSLSEILFVALFFVILRSNVVRRLGKWASILKILF